MKSVGQFIDFINKLILHAEGSELKLHTPGWKSRLQHESRGVRIEHFDELEVLYDRLDQHPEKRNEEEVVEQGGNRTTSAVVGGLVDACQDDDVDRQQGQGQVEQDHLRPSFAELPWMNKHRFNWSHVS